LLCTTEKIISLCQNNISFLLRRVWVKDQCSDLCKQFIKTSYMFLQHGSSQLSKHKNKQFTKLQRFVNSTARVITCLSLIENHDMMTWPGKKQVTTQTDWWLKIAHLYQCVYFLPKLFSYHKQCSTIQQKAKRIIRFHVKNCSFTFKNRKIWL